MMTDPQILAELQSIDAWLGWACLLLVMILLLGRKP